MNPIISTDSNKFSAKKKIRKKNKNTQCIPTGSSSEVHKQLVSALNKDSRTTLVQIELAWYLRYCHLHYM